MIKECMGKREEAIELETGARLSDILSRIRLQCGSSIRDNNVLFAVNMEYRDREYVLSDGDTLAVFPMVTGG
ncbi:MAG: MoaD/ThiS family protein [Candidatus Thermoplasmatota archaeon]|nr:MoaD/ThiS family protein [Candidatus Thermoplasmatota archaeon]